MSELRQVTKTSSEVIDRSTNSSDSQSNDVGKANITKRASASIIEESDIGTGTTTVIHGSRDDAGYHRSLHRRQIMMMTFGAGIGTGLWVGTGQALWKAGPAGTAIAYTVMA
jgi:amino acid permease